MWEYLSALVFWVVTPCGIVQIHTALQPRRPTSTYTPPWKPHLKLFKSRNWRLSQTKCRCFFLPTIWNLVIKFNIYRAEDNGKFGRIKQNNWFSPLPFRVQQNETDKFLPLRFNSIVLSFYFAYWEVGNSGNWAVHGATLTVAFLLLRCCKIISLRNWAANGPIVRPTDDTRVNMEQW
jgi:hypothetical protein